MESAPAQTGSLTTAQQQAVRERGNVLVMAGAGTGKTKTLVERCLDCLECDHAQIDELLIVTFTEAAAAEMRLRLRRAIEQRAAANPAADFWREQLARFDLAHIGTLHGFCLQLVRDHFYELGLDPRVAILDEGESRQLANETLDEQLAAHYEGKKDFSSVVQELIHAHGGGRDENIRKLVHRLHHYSQTRPDAAGWLARQRAGFSAAEPLDWQRWLLQAIHVWSAGWLPVLDGLKAENVKAAELAGPVAQLKENVSREAAAGIFAQIIAADLTANYPKGKAGKLRPALGSIFDEAKFLASLAAVNHGRDPLAEDWSWVRGQMETLLRLAEEFAENLAAAKRADGALDFHDLEQFTLKLLWDFSTGQPTAVARGWRAKLKFVFVDEYQDINAAQDKIIQGLSRDGAEANRFLVGDVKQSIYRFRLADPQIFRDYARSWQGAAGKTLPLSENFRSREGLLNFVNSVCRVVMRPEVGGVAYDPDAELKFGAPDQRKEFGAAQDPAPCAELRLRFKAGRNADSEDEEDELAGLDDARREARLVARRLKQLVAGGQEIFDDQKNIFRPVEWRDIAILLRAARGKTEIFAKEFELAGIPLAIARGGFYQSAEILDLLSLLQLLDNPLQDVPCIAVLRSPFVGLSLDELAEIRLAAREKHFWTTLNHWAQANGGTQDAGTPASVNAACFPLTPALSPGEREKRSQRPATTTLGVPALAGPASVTSRHEELAGKISQFLRRCSRWRKLAKQVSLSQCLEEILAETLYADWLRAQPQGAQRAGNVASFLHLARQFDQFQRQGLFRFLKFIEAQQEAEVEPEVPAAPAENAVRLMSIHQSKGLEFPIVVLADLAKPFNETDLHSDILFDEELGLCPKIKPPSAGGRYPSLPHWLAQRRQRRELRGEELRLLYVALTRARDHLILTASVTKNDWEKKWQQPRPATVENLAGARSFADWLALWFSNQADRVPEAGLDWKIMTDDQLTDPGGEAMPGESGSQAHPPGHGNEVALKTLQERLAWEYPALAATKRKAKTSVTALRREAEESDDEAEPAFAPKTFLQRPNRKLSSPKSNLSAAGIGVAHHKFLQHVELDKTNELAAEAERLARENYLSADEHAALDLEALDAFWHSAPGQAIVAHASETRRELPFTARLSPAEIAAITGRPAEAGLEKEFIVVQGVADLIVLLPDEIWLVDFKTDEVAADELPDKIETYRPQLRLYAAALEKIYGRKVTRRALHFLAAHRTEEI